LKFEKYYIFLNVLACQYEIGRIYHANRSEKNILNTLISILGGRFAGASTDAYPLGKNVTKNRYFEQKRSVESTPIRRLALQPIKILLWIFVLQSKYFLMDELNC